MKILIFLAGLGLAVASSTPSEAALAKKARQSNSKAASSKKGAPAKSTRGHLQTDVSFDDSVLHGEYQTPEEALAKVENEKGLSDLIGVRKHFKDRLPVAAEQE